MPAGNGKRWLGKFAVLALVPRCGGLAEMQGNAGSDRLGSRSPLVVRLLQSRGPGGVGLTVCGSAAPAETCALFAKPLLRPLEPLHMVDSIQAAVFLTEPGQRTSKSGEQAVARKCAAVSAGVSHYPISGKKVATASPPRPIVVPSSQPDPRRR